MTEMPFGVTWCYEETDDEDEQCQVLIIEEPEEVPPLHINISNKLPDKTITINSVDGVNQADANNYHFKLAFLPGILSDPQAVGLESENWSISSVSNSDQDSIYLLWTGGETSLSPGEMIEVILTGVAAQSAVRTTTNNVNVTINWQFKQGGIDVINIERIPDQDDDYDDNTTLKLDMVQSTGKSNIPLYAGFVNCNKVLNTNEEASSLQLRLTNTKLPGAANADLTFNYDSDINLCSQLVITLEVGTADDVPWALAAEDEVNNIAISIPGDQWSQNGDIETIEVGGVVQALQWTFIPQNDVVLAARETMLINLDNIITSHPSGETNLYLGYQYIPGYKDGQFICQIEKAPLVFDSEDKKEVKIDTNLKVTNTLTTRRVFGDGIALTGTILMWSGATDQIPDGWKLCDGDNDTPNLTDRFIVGAGGTYEVADTGGDNSIVLSVDQMPSHDHGVTEEEHSHGYKRIKDRSVYVGTKGSRSDVIDSYGTGNNHDYCTTGAARTGITINKTGGGGSHENRPPYYALCFIMKIKVD